MSKAILASPWTGRHGPLLIAEIGGNHEGEFDSALRLLDLALDSGADYAKFQLLTGDGLVSAVESPDRHRHFQRFELSREQHLALARRCVQAGVGYLASVWDLSMLDWIDDFLSIYKVGSGDLTAYPLLRELARRGKPIILSTGLSTLEEVLDAIKFLQTENPVYCQADKLALMQCTSAYPTPDAQVNLRAMDTLRAATGMPVGYSDHTIGDLAVFVAAARGADLLEFHFTDEREGRSFRDHAVSLTRDDVRRLCQRLDCLRNLLGDGNKVPQPVEVETGHLVSFRRGIYSSRDLVPGERVRAEDLVCLRPNQGVDARQFDGLLGRKVVRSIAAFTAIDFASIGDGE